MTFRPSLAVGLLLALLCACAGADDGSGPTDADDGSGLTDAGWTLRDTALQPGAPGSWDARLYGLAGPGPVFRRGGTYYLYYIGADGDRPTDGGPANRSIGLATSPDGIRWRKHPDNPVIVDQPNGHHEEGFWRLTGWMEEDGTIDLFATRLVLTRPEATTTVHGDIKLYTSEDGVRFEDRGVVVPHDAPGVPGGDEQAVASVYRRASDAEWFVFYSPKGESRAAAYCRGRSKTELSDCGMVRDGELRLSAGSAAIPLDDTVLIPVRRLDGSRRVFRARSSDPRDWDSGGPPLRLGIDVGGGYALYLDRQAATWFLYATDALEEGENRPFEVYTAPFTRGPD